MAKVKNKRNAGLADKVHKKKMEGVKKKLNPFEVHINREKVKVLGKKSKHDRGLPGVARAKAIQKRKETLGTEMRLMNKSNTFIDRRIGEKDNSATAEDKMVARFAAERVKQHNKKSIYNLADDEILTHRGQTLEQIEKFDDPRSSDDEDDERKKFGGLDDNFVADGHFGGGILSKTDSRDGAKSHKDLIEQLIAESKKRKAEKQKEKEQTLDLTEKLDSEWKDLQPVVFKRARVEEESIIDKLLSQQEKKNEDYDKMTRELRFDRRGKPSDGLKSDEKQLREEKEKLEKLEKERQLRMMDDEELNAPTVQTSSKHRSADDLDDNFELEEEKDFMLAYDKDGKPLVPEHILKDYSVPNSKPKHEDRISDTSSDDDDDENEEGDDNEDNKANNDDSNSFDDDGDDDDDDDDNDDDDDDDDDDDNNKSNKEQSSPEQHIKNQNSSNVNINKNREETLQHILNEEIEDSDDEITKGSDNKTNDNCQKSQKDDYNDLKQSDSEGDDEINEVDEEKINSFFNLTSEGDHLNDLLKDKTPSEQSTTLKKLIQTYDPSLSEKNKDLLSSLFAKMLKYVNDVFSGLNNEGEVLKAFLIFDKIAPHFYDLAHIIKVSSKNIMADLLKEKHSFFVKNPKKVPDLDTLIFFKLISLIYPTSDYRHPITTPSLVFMMEILRLGRFNDAYSVSRGFFVIALILEYTSLSKRLVPEALNFIRGILFLIAKTTLLNPIQVVPPFKIHRDSKILNLEENCSKMEVEHKMTAKDLVINEIDNDYKMRCLVTCVLMLKELFNNYNEIEAQECLFAPHLQLLGRIDLDLYPKKVASVVSEVIKHIKSSLEVKTLTPLSKEKKRPKVLRLYEPDIQEVFTGSKSSKLSREQAERARLQHKYKREMKGALREIRRDKAYVASVKIQQKIQGDNIRKDKVKQIYKDASIQQGELNKLKRRK